ncbi:hypothetical protein DO659_24935 [Salmonella enterica subsp. enterica serovar Minnesota]|nr:hypothetical protein [Salmonella enterica subsp. enterica serovar Minnesota]
MKKTGPRWCPYQASDTGPALKQNAFWMRQVMPKEKSGPGYLDIRYVVWTATLDNKYSVTGKLQDLSIYGLF